MVNIILNVCELTFTTHLSTQGLKHEITTLFLFTYIGVSKNRGVSPQIIHFDRVFHYFHHPFWGFSPYIRKHPYIAVFFFTQVVPYEKNPTPFSKPSLKPTPVSPFHRAQGISLQEAHGRLRHLRRTRGRSVLKVDWGWYFLGAKTRKISRRYAGSVQVPTKKNTPKKGR